MLDGIRVLCWMESGCYVGWNDGVTCWMELGCYVGRNDGVILVWTSSLGTSPMRFICVCVCVCVTVRGHVPITSSY